MEKINKLNINMTVTGGKEQKPAGAKINDKDSEKILELLKKGKK